MIPVLQIMLTAVQVGAAEEIRAAGWDMLISSTADRTYIPTRLLRGRSSVVRAISRVLVPISVRVSCPHVHDSMAIVVDLLQGVAHLLTNTVS